MQLTHLEIRGSKVKVAEMSDLAQISLRARTSLGPRSDLAHISLSSDTPNGSNIIISMETPKGAPKGRFFGEECEVGSI